MIRLSLQRMGSQMHASILTHFSDQIFGMLGRLVILTAPSGKNVTGFQEQKSRKRFTFGEWSLYMHLSL